MRMLRWSADVTMHDKNRNELIRGTFGVKDPTSSKSGRKKAELVWAYRKVRGKVPFAENEGL